MLLKMPATSFIFHPKVLYNKDIFKPVLMHVIIIFHITNISRIPDMSSPKTVNQPHVFFSLLSINLIMVFSSIRVSDFNL